MLTHTITIIYNTLAPYLLQFVTENLNLLLILVFFFRVLKKRRRKIARVQYKSSCSVVDLLSIVNETSFLAF